MGQASSTIDFATALRDPTAFFSEPNDIVAHPQLSREMKLALLRQWEQTARSLSVAEFEGMGGGEENKLGRVELAIALVEKQPEQAEIDALQSSDHLLKVFCSTMPVIA